ncbi:hypothetical protein LEP1GSC021_3139 [Leptospira noguchii str. 1993005606]|uniref:Uncharacterized protein n=2 Tax=Leptospira noguchii TaxID=28182 RepID=M6Y729_9LEPT|nr:hypothetical protein LEP1GSC035_4923 [Leptospira noguchii str. 2007001578]EMO89530.1 hypothetical protein LEP1GSC024_1567 [Leptospira noguchii str. 2001034031]EPE86068.1 hypothetical protein LEP1GSC021_3139 [Leptospira noguchii str. 1993005606]
MFSKVVVLGLYFIPNLNRLEGLKKEGFSHSIYFLLKN